MTGNRAERLKDLIHSFVSARQNMLSAWAEMVREMHEQEMGAGVLVDEVAATSNAMRQLAHTIRGGEGVASP